MNKQERELAYLELKGEREVLETMRDHYRVALDRVNEEIDRLAERTDISGIRQKQYQEELAEQIGGIIDDLGSGSYASLEDYLSRCYEESFVGTLYNLQRQGIPLAFPLDQESMARSVTRTADDIKLSDRVYDNVGKMQKQVAAEITRGFADGSHVSEIADRIANETDIATEIKKRVAGRTDQALRRAMTIARTEKGRVRAESKMAAMYRARDEGADIVKQWDSTMDSRTREDHRRLNGQIRELDEDFEIRGVHGPAPHKMGRPEHDINCRCVCLQRARAALEMEEGLDYTKWDGVNQCKVDLSDAGSYQEFKSRYDALAATHKMAAENVRSWPPRYSRMPEAERRKIMQYARGKGIEVQGLRTEGLDPVVVTTLIDAADLVSSDFPELRGEGRRPLTLIFESLDDEDFGRSSSKANHVIRVNSKAARNEEALKREYGEQTRKKWFVPGSDYRAIAYHEFGHIYLSRTDVSAKELVESVIREIGDDDPMSVIAGELSGYAADSYKDGDYDEIIAETFSAHYSNAGGRFANMLMDRVKEARSS